MTKVPNINYALGRLNLVKFTYKYLIVNKPSGVKSDGVKDFKNHLIPQVTKIFEELHPGKEIDYRQFQMIQRLDKFVTGGLIVSRDEKFTKQANKSFREQSANAFRPEHSSVDTTLNITRRYVGLISTNKPIDTHDREGVTFTDPENGTGIITLEIDAVKDRLDHEVRSYDSITKFRILQHLKTKPTEKQLAQYPDLYPKNTFIYPIIFELETGRKNQIRDHVIQAFETPLLNDDNFNDFKMVTTKDALMVDVNSKKYKTNQIGLHSAYIKMKRSNKLVEEIMFPVFDQNDRDLWLGFINRKTGELNSSIKSAIYSFNTEKKETVAEESETEE